MILARETLGLRRTSFSLVLSLLISAFSLPEASHVLVDRALSPLERSPTTLQCRVRSFGGRLEPRYIFRAGSLDQ